MSKNNYSLLDRQFTIKLYSSPLCPQCHRVRFLLAEKELDYETIIVDSNNRPPELAELNPYNSVPTLVDRDITVYEPRIIFGVYRRALSASADDSTRSDFTRSV